MKTNVTLLSQSRELFGITIRQETKTGFLNLSDLQVAYDKAKAEEGWSNKIVQEVLSYMDNKERIYYILHKQGFIKSSLNEFIELVENKGITNTLKSLGVYSMKGRGSNRTTVCNPYIWMLLAMEMNPKLYGEVVTWLTDKLILNRIEAGDLYRDLSKSISKFKDVDYGALAKALNYIVFGRHESGIRNTGTEEQLSELRNLELNLSYTIDSGFIKSFPSLMEHLRVLWAKKHNPIQLRA